MASFNETGKMREKALDDLVKGRGITAIRPTKGRAEHVNCKVVRIIERERLKKKWGRGE